jgi:hypothetical protein
MIGGVMKNAPWILMGLGIGWQVVGLLTLNQFIGIVGMIWFAMGYLTFEVRRAKE